MGNITALFRAQGWSNESLSALSRFYVNSVTGVVAGVFTRGGEFVVKLLAVDKGGNKELVDTYKFSAFDPPVFAMRPGLQRTVDERMNSSTGYRSVYTINETYTLRAPPISKADLFLGAGYEPRAVQHHPNGGQPDFVWLPARTTYPHGAYA